MLFYAIEQSTGTIQKVEIFVEKEQIWKNMKITSIHTGEMSSLLCRRDIIHTHTLLKYYTEDNV